MKICVHIQFCLGSFRQKQPWLASIYLSKLLRQLASFYQHRACQGIAINFLAGGMFLSPRRKGAVVVSSCPAALQREKINKETRKEGKMAKREGIREKKPHSCCLGCKER